MSLGEGGWSVQVLVDASDGGPASRTSCTRPLTRRPPGARSTIGRRGFVSFGVEPLVRRILDPEKKLAYWNEHPVGGHFPAMEAPDLLVQDLRAFFGSYR